MSTFRAKKKGKSGHGFHEVDIGLDKRVDIVVQNNMNKINNIQKVDIWLDNILDMMSRN